MEGSAKDYDDSDGSQSLSEPEASDADSTDFQVISVSKGTEGASAGALQSRPDDSPLERRGAGVKPAADTGGKGGGSDKKSLNVDRKPTEDVTNVGIQSGYLNQWVQSAIAMQGESGVSFTEMVRRNKNFRNPAIFEKMISYCDIDEFGTQLPPQKALQENDCYESIAEFQEVCMKEAL